MNEMIKDHPSSGVEALIERLREKGVQQGQQQAEQIIEEAERRAEWLLDQARQEADQLLAKARKEATRMEQAGLDALKIAARDMNLEVKQSLRRSFTDQVERLVAQQLDNAEFMQRLILEVARSTRKDSGMEQAEEVELLLPEGVIGLEELRRNPHEYKDGKLSRFVQSLTAEQLREGLSLDLHSGDGLQVRLSGTGTEIDLRGRAISALLLRHLQPRFRAILEGVIK